MSSTATDSKSEESEIETEHPIQVFLRDYVGLEGMYYNADVKWKIRRGIEVGLTVFLIFGLIYWVFLFLTA